MNTIFYQQTSMKVVHRLISSEFIRDLAHDYRSSLNPPTAPDIKAPTPEERQKEKSKLLTAIADYKKFVGTKDHNDQKNEFIKTLLACRVPNWGNVTFKPL